MITNGDCQDHWYRKMLQAVSIWEDTIVFPQNKCKIWITDSSSIRTSCCITWNGFLHTAYNLVNYKTNLLILLVYLFFVISERPMELMLSLHNGINTGLLWSGLSGKQLCRVEPFVSIVHKLSITTICTGLMVNSYQLQQHIISIYKSGSKAIMM